MNEFESDLRVIVVKFNKRSSKCVFENSGWFKSKLERVTWKWFIWKVFATLLNQTHILTWTSSVDFQLHVKIYEVRNASDLRVDCTKHWDIPETDYAGYVP